VEISYGMIAIIGTALLALWFLLRTYNCLVGMRNNVRNAWSNIDVQLKLRHDLVPNLVESVKGYMTHERETLEGVVRARSKAIASGGHVIDRASAEMALAGAVGNLFAAAERYPDLKASKSFLLLQEQITSTENRIAFARQHYNDKVRQFNTAIAEFPRNLVTGTLGFKPAEMFAAGTDDRAAIGVKV